MAKITLGPVIGKVTDTTARVLIEVDQDCQEKCIAEGPEGKVPSEPKELKKDHFTAFQLNDLKPNTKYQVNFEGASCEIPCYFKTFEENPQKMNIGVVSCNFPIRRRYTDLWTDMRNRYVSQGKLDLLLHVGDQVYGDSAFDQSMDILSQNDIEEEEKENKIIELYSNLYRTNWRFPPTRETLAQVPNLMIWDDHEITDGWGSHPEDWDSNSLRYKVGTLAQKVFRRYQRQLWDDKIPETPGLEDHPPHKWGAIGILFIDQRGGRSFKRDSARPYLGTEQWEKISKALKPGGDFENVRGLIVVTSVPLVFLSSSITNKGSEFQEDLQDHWNYSAHGKEQIEMIRALRLWKEAGKGSRELLVVGGDVHIGCQTNIEHENKLIFKQLVTSPVTNKPPSGIKFDALRIALEAKERLGANYSFEHFNCTAQRNYGIVIVRIPKEMEKTPKVDGTLEISQTTYPQFGITSVEELKKYENF